MHIVRTPVVVGIPLEHDPVARSPFLDHPRAGHDRRPAEIVTHLIRRSHAHRGQERAGQVVEERGIWLFGHELERVLIDDRRLGHRADCGSGGYRPGFRVQDPVKARLDRFRVQGCAVMEGDIFPQLEGPGQPVFGDLPFSREPRHELSIEILSDEWIARIPENGRGHRRAGLVRIEGIRQLGDGDHQLAAVDRRRAFFDLANRIGRGKE